MSFKEDFETGITPLLETVFDAYPQVQKIVLADWSNTMLYDEGFYGPCFCEWTEHPDNEIIYWMQLKNSGLLDPISDFIGTYTKAELCRGLTMSYGKTDSTKASLIIMDNSGDELVIREDCCE